MTTEGDHHVRQSSHSGHRPGGVPPHERLTELRTFFTSMLRNPRMVGAAAPTSRAVADTVAQVVPSTGAPVVVELGPGTGTLSQGIHGRMPPDGRHIGIELGRELVQHLRHNLPWLEVIHGDAADLLELLDEGCVGTVDVVVSSLPWTLIDVRTRQDILRQVSRLLTPQGTFTALTYVHATHSVGSRVFRRQLGSAFDEVLTHTTWRNLPPITHYICRRPLA